MRDLFVLATALETVEQHLTEPCSVEALAKACHISVSGLQKLFAYALQCSVGEYTSKRRLSAAAYELVHTEKKITEIALTYQYASPEVFSRAFKRFWGMLPSVYRRELRFSELFPRLEVPIGKEGDDMSKRRKVEITQLYDQLKKLGGTYVLCADVCKLSPINQTYGYGAGDLALAETAKRLDTALSEEMLLFRIGRDEFVAVTGLDTLSQAMALAETILTDNGKPVRYEGNDIPLSLRIGISKIPAEGLSYKEVLDRMHDTINQLKETGGLIGVDEG